MVSIRWPKVAIANNRQDRKSTRRVLQRAYASACIPKDGPTWPLHALDGTWGPRSLVQRSVLCLSS